jgi:DNA-binding response OmpR family regulator
MNILLIEDNNDLVTNLFDYFEARGHVIDVASNGISGLELTATNSYDALILDWMLPSMDGITMCKRLRETGKTTPVLMLTARDSLDDKIAGFEAGADDYVVKPFLMREVEARLLALVRRSQAHCSSGLLQVGNLTFNSSTLKVMRGERNIVLPPIALKFLEFLMRQSPRVVTREEVERYIWGCAQLESDTLRAHLFVLRNAVDQKTDQPLIKTLRGIGYQIINE